MSYPITKKNIEGLCERINKAAGTPEAPWTRTEDGLKQNAGNYHLDWAYGGVKLVQMCDSGGERDITCSGFVPKRQLWYEMHAFLVGIESRS